MSRFKRLSAFFSATLILSLQAIGAESIKMVPFHRVEASDEVWRPRLQTLMSRTLPHAFTQTEVAQRRLRLCAEYLESGGTTPKPEAHRFNDSDLYKVMEGAALVLKFEPNPEMEALMDRIIGIIARAQKPDGYLYISHICGNPIVNEMGRTPYSYVFHSHELYNMGHLYEAAVAYAEATGKTNLLQVAEKNAQHVNKVFFEGDPNYNGGKPVNQAPGHQEIEIGLVKLHHYTGNPLYLEMSRRFLDIRGVTFVPDGRGVNSATYAQQHLPVAKQREATGHAVRATYQYAAMAEVESLMGTTEYSEALDSIWHDIVDSKMHISGGLGAVHGIEGFGPAYDLPNKEAYLETCAAVGNVFFNMRLFLKHGDARYVDVAEVALLNNCLSGVGLDGTSFFYENPLEADDGHRPRSGWFGTACCPANISRLIPQVSGYMYAQSGNSLYTLLYGGNRVTAELKDGRATVTQTTRYPYDGDVTLAVDPEKPFQFRLHVRIPTWAGAQFVPGKLYHYAQPSTGWWIEVNGSRADAAQFEKGFVVLDRVWKKGDQVKLHLPMPVKVNTCIEPVTANRERVAVTRGPLLFCAEGVDNHGMVQRFFVEPKRVETESEVKPIQAGLLAGLPGITIPARQRSTATLVEQGELKLIPYFAWSNRDRSSMMTWMGTREGLARIDYKDPRNAKFSKVSASFTYEGDTVEAIQMDHTPKSSDDHSIPRWTSHPRRGEAQWVQIDLRGAQEVRSVSVYWFDDNRGVHLPGGWHVEARVNGAWERVAIYNTDEYSLLRDTYNLVHPAQKLVTDAIRIVMKPRSNEVSVGILSVNIEATGTGQQDKGGEN